MLYDMLISLRVCESMNGCNCRMSRHICGEGSHCIHVHIYMCMSEVCVRVHRYSSIVISGIACEICPASSDYLESRRLSLPMKTD